jgi:hypothetical protein
MAPQPRDPSLFTRLRRHFDTRTAVGEWVLDMRIGRQGRESRALAEHNAARVAGMAWRYDIEKGDAYEENAALFERVYARTDGLVLGGRLEAPVETAVENYLFVLSAFRERCRGAGCALVVSYFPAYPEVYESSSPMLMRARLSEWCARSEVPFLDLTPAFREKGRDAVLHLAPVDFHANPTGNRVIATAVADMLAERGLLDADYTSRRFK